MLSSLPMPAPLGAPGFPLPDPALLTAIPADEDGRAALSRLGIDLVAPADPSNIVCVCAHRPAGGLKVRFGDTSGNRLVLGPARRLGGQVHFTGSRNAAIFAGTPAGKGVGGAYTVQLRIVSTGSVFYAGPETTIGGADIWLQGEGRHILIGQDCMISWDVKMRSGDAHSIIDVSSRSVTNLADDVVIGPHVWLGYEVDVMKGAQVGAGSVIGSGATVTRPVPPLSLAVGQPARVIRSGTTWSRTQTADAGEIERILSLPFLQPHVAGARPAGDTAPGQRAPDRTRRRRFGRWFR